MLRFPFGGPQPARPHSHTFSNQLSAFCTRRLSRPGFHILRHALEFQEETYRQAASVIEARCGLLGPAGRSRQGPNSTQAQKVADLAGVPIVQFDGNDTLIQLCNVFLQRKCFPPQNIYLFLQMGLTGIRQGAN